MKFLKWPSMNVTEIHAYNTKYEEYTLLRDKMSMLYSATHYYKFKS